MHLSTYFAKAIILLNAVSIAFGEIKVFDESLDATSQYVRYSTTYLIDPGTIDLTNVKFVVSRGTSQVRGTDDYYYGNGDDDEALGEDDGDDENYYWDDDDAVPEDDDYNIQDISYYNVTGNPPQDDDEDVITDDVDEFLTDDDTVTDDLDDFLTDDDTVTDDLINEPSPEDTIVNNTLDVNNTLGDDTGNANNITYEESANITTPNVNLTTPEVVVNATANSTGEYILNTTSDITANETVAENSVNVTNGDNGQIRKRRLGRESTVDVLFFHEPSDCTSTREGCDWVELGIGNLDEFGGRQWCCSQEAVSLGLCSSDHIGRMIVNFAKYQGEHRTVTIPDDEEFFEGTITSPVMTTQSHGSGQYTLLIANCDDFGTDVHIVGEYVYKSKNGFLPGDLYNEWYFTIVLTLFYGSLFFWYGMRMNKNKEATIGIQKWILATIFLGLLETFFCVDDFGRWNRTGERSQHLMYLAITIGVLKGAISRCLLIMVSLGWGVIKDSLGAQMKKIVSLGLFYVAMAFLRDIAGVVFVEELHVLSANEEEEIYDFFTFFSLITSVIDVVCYMWILNGLSGTMQYLDNMNQSRKLQRYLKLRCILIVSILFALFWSVIGVLDEIVDSVSPFFAEKNQEWVIPAAMSMNYLFILVSIATLWRPEPHAKEFASVMELPSIGDEDDIVRKDIEML